MAGPENGQPVILLHGGGQTRHSWSKALSELAAAGYKVISPDLRGHGESQWCPEGRYTLDDYMVDLGLIMGTLVSSPILVGASLGGVVSLVGLGEQQLPPARALVLVDVVPRMESAGVKEIIDFMSANSGGFVSIDAAAHAVGQYLPSNAGSPEDIETMAQRMEAAARLIDVPTLVMRGGRSRVVSAEGVAHLAELIPHADFVDIAEAGHMVVGDQNDEFNAVIREFLVSSCGSA